MSKISIKTLPQPGRPQASVAGAALTLSNGTTNHGTIELYGAGVFTATLTVSSGTLVNANDGVIQTAGNSSGGRTLAAQLDNQGTVTLATNCPLNLTQLLTNSPGGTIQGSSTLDLGPAGLVDAGTISPGLSPGTLPVIGKTRFVAGGRLALEVGGDTNGTFDKVTVSDSLRLAGGVLASRRGRPRGGGSRPSAC